MGSIKEKIKYIKETKKLIREAIIAQGVDVPENTTFRDYANKIDEIPSGVDINEYYDLTKKTSGGINAYIKQIPMIDTSQYTNMDYMFNSYSSLTTIPQLDTSKVTSMTYMFSGCSSLTTIPLLDTSKITSMYQLFVNCESLTEIPQLNTSNVTNMNFMFGYCKNLITIPQLDTSKVTNMYNMFISCSSLTTIPQLNTSNAINMSYMFSGCSSLTTIPLLDTSKVTSMNGIFNYCSSLTTLGGFTNLGQSYETTKSANYYGYTLDLSYSKNLTHDSLMNIINNLYNIAAKGCKVQRLQLGSTNLAKLTEEEISIATNKGWSVS